MVLHWLILITKALQTEIHSGNTLTPRSYNFIEVWTFLLKYSFKCTMMHYHHDCQPETLAVPSRVMKSASRVSGMCLPEVPTKCKRCAQFSSREKKCIHAHSALNDSCLCSTEYNLWFLPLQHWIEPLIPALTALSRITDSCLYSTQ